MVEGARLERVYRLIAYRGFESLPHCQLFPLLNSKFWRVTNLTNTLLTRAIIKPVIDGSENQAER